MRSIDFWNNIPQSSKIDVLDVARSAVHRRQVRDILSDPSTKAEITPNGVILYGETDAILLQHPPRLWKLALYIFIVIKLFQNERE